MQLKKFYSLEILRFYAALVVFIGHYIHFPMHYGFEFSDATLPIPQYLKAFGYGGLAVPSFFMISGIIFAHIYSEKIIHRKITLYEFVKKRFARLYPLHFVTLIILVFLLFLLKNETSFQFFIYPENDIKHFILHLFFMSNWGIENGLAFNGPIWSVSNEVIFYLLFFLIIYHFGSNQQKIYKLYLTIVITMYLCQRIGLTFSNISLLLIQKNLFIFFAGALLYELIYKAPLQKAIYLTMFFIIAWLFLPFIDHIPSRAGLTHGLLLIIIIASLLIVEKLNIFEIFFHHSILSIFSFFGNLTYSTYLIHIPIQIGFVIYNEKVAKLDFFSSNVFLAYVFIVLIMGRIVFLIIEQPAKKLILR